ncbi:TPA: DUF6279 family lipoprotein [Vibrio vulnificus]
MTLGCGSLGRNKTIWRTLSYLALAFILLGCSNKFLYTNLDWVVLEYVDDYVTLENEQEAMLDERLQQLLRWHQEEELPLYAKQLQQLETINSAQVSAEFVIKQRAAIKQHTVRLVTRAAPDIYALTLSLSAKQEQELLNNLAKKYQELDEKYGGWSEQERRRRYVERIEESLEKWIGRLNTEQKALVVRWADELQITTPHWREHRNKMLEVVRQLLNNKHDPHYLHENLMRLLLQPESYYSPELSKKVNFNIALANQYIPQISQTMSDKQWRHFRSEVKNWRDLASELNNQIVGR